MTRTSRNAFRRRWLGTVLGLTATLALVACGAGGVGGIAGVGSGGTGSFTSGSISGFGSVIVNQIHYDESGATIRTEDDRALQPGQLQLGMVVEINGSEAVTSPNGQRRSTASRIALRSEIEGPVSVVNAANGTMTVLGQIVRVNARTVFDSDLAGGLRAVQPGDILEVYGFQDADGNYLASRVDREAARPASYKLRGAVRGLDTAGRSFRIGALTVGYPVSTDVSGLQNGAQVRVLLDPQSGQGERWNATRVDIQSGSVISNPPGVDQLHVELEGIVTAFSSPRRFSVNGVDVDASAVAFIPANLGLGSRVEVDGDYAQGVIRATEVELDDEDGNDMRGDFELEGPIANLDTVAQTFTLRGVTVAYGGARFSGGDAGGLADGVQVEVEARLAEDGSTLVAREIEFDDDRSGADQGGDFELAGRIASVNAAESSFVLRNYTVRYAGAQFDEGTAAGLAAGRLVEVEGRLQADGRTVIASRIEFDEE
ncbi:MAG: DUF5666 domain-containing protein [Burkholderiaceae bacterium]